MYLVKSLSRDKGSGRYTMYLPFSPYRFLGAKGQIHCVSARPLVPGKGLYQIHGQSLNTHRGLGVPNTSNQFVRPEKWGDSQVGFRGSNASGGPIVLLPSAFWAHGTSKMAILGASLLLCILQCFGASEGMLPPGACRSSRDSARRIVSCRGLCVSSLCPQIPHAPAPTFGGF